MGIEPLARRGLAFADHSSAPLPSAQNSNTFTTNHHLTTPASSHPTLPGDSQSRYRKPVHHPITPDANRSGDFNNSNLTGPSPTVFTKQALMVVGDMFCGPLHSEHDVTLGPRQEMDKTEKDFEAGFSNADYTTTVPFSNGFGGMGKYRLSHPYSDVG